MLSIQTKVHIPFPLFDRISQHAIFDLFKQRSSKQIHEQRRIAPNKTHTQHTQTDINKIGIFMGRARYFFFASLLFFRFVSLREFKSHSKARASTRFGMIHHF